jgi:hypothetical protein
VEPEHLPDITPQAMQIVRGLEFVVPS